MKEQLEQTGESCGTRGCPTCPFARIGQSRTGLTLLMVFLVLCLGIYTLPGQWGQMAAIAASLAGLGLAAMMILPPRRKSPSTGTPA